MVDMTGGFTVNALHRCRSIACDVDEVCPLVWGGESRLYTSLEVGVLATQVKAPNLKI